MPILMKSILLTIICSLATGAEENKHNEDFHLVTLATQSQRYQLLTLSYIACRLKYREPHVLDFLTNQDEEQQLFTLLESFRPSDFVAIVSLRKWNLSFGTTAKSALKSLQESGESLIVSEVPHHLKSSDALDTQAANRFMKIVYEDGVLMGKVDSVLDALKSEPKNENDIPISDEAKISYFNDTSESSFTLFIPFHRGSISLEIPLKTGFKYEAGDINYPILILNQERSTQFFNAAEISSDTQCQFQPKNKQWKLTVETPTEEFPVLLLVLNVTNWAPFFEDVLQGLTAQDYPKEKIHFVFSLKDNLHGDLRKWFSEKYENAYASYEEEQSADVNMKTKCEAINCDFAVYVEPSALLERQETLKDLVNSNRPLISPLLLSKTRNNMVAQPNGFEELEKMITKRSIRGLFFVHGSSGLILASKDVIYAENVEVPLSIINKDYYGYLIDPRGEKPGRLHADLWGVSYNFNLWSRRYIHPDLRKIIKRELEPQQVGPYLFYVPFYTERFCKEIIEEAEHNGNWYDPKKEDKRDITHQYTSMNINLEDLDYEVEQHTVINTYHKWLNSVLYPNFESHGESVLMFVLKYYGGSEYNTFKYHLDGGTYTYNIALNSNFGGGGVDYKIGNENFEEAQEFRVSHNKTGWAFIQPCRPLHVHRGTQITSGIRYAMINIISTNDDTCKGGPHIEI